MPFEFKNLEIPDLVLIEPKVFSDPRGFFMESYHQADFEKAGIHSNFIQDNHAHSQKGVLRGLHYQNEPFAQGKLIRCIKGSIFDVAVDIRKESPAFGKWVGVMLSGQNRLIFWIPKGFAHGYLTLEDETEVLYKTDSVYAPRYEQGILWNDPDLAIDWPMKSPVLSEKDLTFSGFKALMR